MVIELSYSKSDQFFGLPCENKNKHLGSAELNSVAGVYWKEQLLLYPLGSVSEGLQIKSTNRLARQNTDLITYIMQDKIQT